MGSLSREQKIKITTQQYNEFLKEAGAALPGRGAISQFAMYGCKFRLNFLMLTRVRVREGGKETL